MRRRAETRNLRRVRDDLLQPVRAEGPEADGRRAVDASERPVHVLLGPAWCCRYGGCRCGDQWGGFICHIAIRSLEADNGIYR